MSIYQEMTQVLESDHRLLDELLETLARETESLKKRKFEHLETVSQKKNELMAKLEQNFNRRMEILKPCAPSEQEQDPERLLAHLLDQLTSTQAHLVRQKNQQLEAKLSQCRHINGVNGQVIAVNLSNHQAVSRILSGQNRSADTYTATGRLNSNQHSNRHQKI